MVNYLHYLDTPALWKESGSRIRKRRLSLGIKSRNAFSEQIGKYTACGPDTIKAIESGREPIKRLAPLGAICTVLDCDPEYITCQCDTLRKEYADPVQRFGLSEQALKVMEAAPGPEGFSSVVDFVLCSENVRQAFRSLLKLNDRILEKDRAIWERSSKEYEKLQKRRNEIKTQVIFGAGFKGTIISKTDFLTDSYGQYVIRPEQARYIAEQQLIAEIRKALEK
jgi:transcriptional regulator with XRE-family HTH domain